MLLTRAKIADFDQFWSVFSSRGAEQRRAFGCKGSRVLRTTETADEVWVLFDWSWEDFQRFLADPTSQEIMSSAGLQGPPEAVSVEAVGELDS